MFCFRFSFPPVFTCFSMLSINHDVNSSTVSYPNKVTNRITQSPFPCSFLNNSSLLYYTTLTIYILKRHNNNIVIIVNNKTTFAISTHIIQMIIVPTQPFHTVLFLIASSSSSLFHAINAQPETPRAVHYISNQPFTILLVVIAIAFFITVFFSFYIRHCSETYLVSGTTPIGFGPKGLDPQVLATFPILLYSTVKAGQNAALQCAVCLSEFVDSDKLRLLPKCSHVFHPNCIDAWLASHVTCPVCRAYLNADRAEVTLEIEHENVAHQVFDESYVRSGNGGNEGGIRGNVDGCIGKDNGSSKMRAFGVLVRSHSTGHSLVELHKKDMERFTLRLSEEVRKQILDYDKRGGRGNLIMKRSVSYGFLQGEEGCSGKGWWGRTEGGEGSSKGKNKGWILSMTPPFVSRGLSSSGVTQNASTTCSGIPMFWASSIVREDKESDSRTIFQVL